MGKLSLSPSSKSSQKRLNIASNSNLKDRYPVVVLLGPTAVGKTQLLSDLFKGLAEVINADSRQVYRGLTIGTAKPDCKITAAIAHHLVDIKDPDEQYTAGEFVHDADGLIPAICGRGKIPIISGGTPFYFRSFLFGLPDTPLGVPGLRRAIQMEINRDGLSAAYDALVRVDPITAERISPRDRYRIERALEVYRGTGRPLSSFPVPSAYRNVYRMLLVGIERARSELYERINRRAEIMFQNGLVAEVGGLLKKGYTSNTPGLQGIGYREFFTMMREGCMTTTELVEIVARNTRRYAKRQITFFKKFPQIIWFNANDKEPIYKAVRTFLQSA